MSYYLGALGDPAQPDAQAVARAEQLRANRAHALVFEVTSVVAGAALGYYIGDGSLPGAAAGAVLLPVVLTLVLGYGLGATNM